MAYIGNDPQSQAFTPAVDYFSGNGSTTAFTLSRPVASVAQVEAVVANVVQNPSSAYSVSGNTITFTSAPPTGTNNVYVKYTSPITQVIQPSQGTVGTTQLASNILVPATGGGTGLSSPGTSGNVLTSNGTAWVSQAITSLPGFLSQIYTTAGSYTFTIPSGVTALKVTVIGGGGGGGNSGTAGGSSTIASGTQTITTVTGGGGPGGVTGNSGGGTATNGDINLTGGTGTRCFSDNGTPITGSGGAAGGGDGFSLFAANVGSFYSGGGGPWGRGASAVNSATGFGSGGSYSSTLGGGGGGAGVAIKWLTGLTPGNTIAVTVGSTPGNGTAGAVIFEW